jgi:hypothetical protein
MKIRPVGAEFSMRMGGRTERHDEANSRFSQFCERTDEYSTAVMLEAKFETLLPYSKSLESRA